MFNGWGISGEIALRLISPGPTDDESHVVLEGHRSCVYVLWKKSVDLL